MANIVIISTLNNIETDYGIYSSSIGFSKTMKNKNMVGLIGLKSGDLFVEMTLDGVLLPLVWTVTSDCYVVDSIDGVAPTSNLDLYNKLVGIINSQKIVEIDEASSTITYIGKSNPGSSGANPVWSIQRIDTSVVGQTIILYADGNTQEDNIWNDRAILSYS